MKTLITLIVATCLVGAAFGQPPSQPSKPGPEHQKLDIWVGDWQYWGEVQGSPMGPAGRVVGKMTVRHILGGLFVEFRNEETGPTGTNQYLEVDGYDPVNKRYTWNGFSSDGSANAVTYTIDGTTVRYSGTAVVAGKQYQIRGTVVFATDFMSDVEKREYSTDGKTWAPLFEGKFTRVKAAPAESASKVQQQEPSVMSGSLLGTWELVSYKYGNMKEFADARKNERRIKMVTETHYVWFSSDPNTKVIQSGAGGSYSLNGNTYTESNDFAIGDMTRFLGGKHIFTVRVEDNKYTQSGAISSGLKIEEVWRRVR